MNTLAEPTLAAKIKDSLAYRQKNRQWRVVYARLMPDHFHGLFRFGHAYEMKRVVPDEKRFLTFGFRRNPTGFRLSAKSDYHPF